MATKTVTVLSEAPEVGATTDGSLELKVSVSTSTEVEGMQYVLTIETTDAEGIDGYIFVYEAIPNTPGHEIDAYRFVTVATLSMLEDLPKSEATEESKGLCRLAHVTMVYPSMTALNEAKDEIIRRAMRLVNNYEASAQTVPIETVTFTFKAPA